MLIGYHNHPAHETHNQYGAMFSTLPSDPSAGHERQSRSRTIDVVLHCGRPAKPDRATTSPFTLMGNATHRYPRKIGMPAKKTGRP